MGLLEAGLVLLVVQMAVTLAAGRHSFDVRFGPATTREVAVSTGAIGGVVLVLLLVGCLIPVARLIGRLSGRAQLRTRQRLLHAYLLASWEVRSRYPEGHLQELLTTFAQAAERSVAQFLGAAMALCGLSAILSVAFIASPAVAVVAVLCVALVGLMLRPVMGLTRSASSAYVTDNQVFAGRMAEVARLTPEIAAFDVAEPVEAAMVARSAAVAASLQRLRTLARINNGLYQYVALLLIVLAIGGASQFADPKTLATMGAVLLLLVRALAYGQQLQSQVQGASENAPFLVMIEQQLAVLGEARVERRGVVISEPTPVWLEDVRFAYEPGQDVLCGLTFGIMPDELLGIVGPSGVGKSTLVQLLLRLQRPTGGSIMVGDVSLEQVSLSRWYELVAYVPQDNKLILGTVMDNIRFFRADVGDDAVRQAARRAHLHEEITLMPEGYDTVVGPGARDLSGGQRQRLGIARALAGPARLLILDEPTSALDARSEQLVAETLSELRGSMAIVIVAHRPATTAICDRIIRIRDGRASLVPAESGGVVRGH